MEVWKQCAGRSSVCNHPGASRDFENCHPFIRELWGRYWGSDEEIDNLHFEVCYYAPIAWAIANGVQQFDPGHAREQRHGQMARATDTARALPSTRTGSKA